MNNKNILDICCTTKYEQKLLEEIENLKQELQQKDEIIEKAIKFMKSVEMDKTDKYIPIRDYKEYEILFNILNKYKGYNNE